MQALAIGVLGGQLPKLGDQLLVPAVAQVDVDALLEGTDAKLFQASGLHSSARQVGELGQGRTAPERQRRAQPLARARVIAVSRRTHGSKLSFEAPGVDLIVVELEDIAGGAGLQPCR
jgi:hypothetical protein